MKIFHIKIQNIKILLLGNIQYFIHGTVDIYELMVDFLRV